jgi:outer membrane protein assembly factor BamB
LNRHASTILQALLLAAALVSLAWWSLSGPRQPIEMSVSGMDNREAVSDEMDESVDIGANFERLLGIETNLSDTWPRFRGPDFDNIKKKSVPLINDFDGAPRVVWTADLGEGHAGPAVYKGKVYVLDYSEEKMADVLRCFSLREGRELWRRWYAVTVKRNHGMSRTIPAVTEDYILTIGPRSHVMCLQRETGDLLWGLDVEKEYETEIPFWYTGQCPYIDDGKAIIATGGRALLVAIDCATGEKLWEVPNDGNWKMSHSSVMPWTHDGIKMYVYSAVGGVCGVGAEGEHEGRLLWSSTEWSKSVVAPSALGLPGGRLFLTAGYGAGSMMFQLNVQGDQFLLEKLYEYKPNAGLACEQQTPVFFDGALFGILPKDAGIYRNQLVCVSPDDTREFLWTSGKTHRFGLGPYMIADGKMFVLNDDGMLSIVRPGTRGFSLVDQVRVFEGHDAWAPLAIADGYLLLRDANTMMCLDIAKI